MCPLKKYSVKSKEKVKHLDYLLDVVPGFELFQQQHSLLGLLVSLNFVLNHQWDLRDFLNAVS